MNIRAYTIASDQIPYSPKVPISRDSPSVVSPRHLCLVAQWTDTGPLSETLNKAYLLYLMPILSPLAMDASAREAMKDAAKCDKHCELQNSVKQ